MTVVLVGYGDYEELNAIEHAVNEYDTDVMYWDVRKWPGSTPLTYDVTNGKQSIGDELDFNDITGVFVYRNYLFSRREERFRNAFETSDGPKKFVQLKEWRAVLDSFIGKAKLHGTTVLNPPQMHHWHSSKIEQLTTFRDNDVSVPETLFSNDAERVQRFIDTHGTVVAKPVTYEKKTYKISAGDVTPELLDTLSSAPVQFQEFIPGEDMRVYFLGNEIIGSTVYCADSWSFKTGTVHDIESITLDEEIREDVETVAELSPINFGAIDVRQSENNYGILESNPHPRFIAHERHAGVDISTSIAQYLCGRQ